MTFDDTIEYTCLNATYFDPVVFFSLLPLVYNIAYEYDLRCIFPNQTMVV